MNRRGFLKLTAALPIALQTGTPRADTAEGERWESNYQGVIFRDREDGDVPLMVLFIGKAETVASALASFMGSVTQDHEWQQNNDIEIATLADCMGWLGKTGHVTRTLVGLAVTEARYEGSARMYLDRVTRFGHVGMLDTSLLDDSWTKSGDSFLAAVIRS